MQVTENQLQEAHQRLLAQRREYIEAEIPIDFSPKTVVLMLKGFERRLIKATRAIEKISLQITNEPASESPLTPGHSDSAILAIPTIHFDFEEAEVNLIRLASGAIAAREKVKLVQFELKDMFVDIDTVRPFDIPTGWNSCLVQDIPIVGIDHSPLGDPKNTGFLITSTRSGTKIDNLKNPSIDVRLTRVKLYNLLRNIIDGTKGKRSHLVNIEFETESHA